MAFQPIVDLSTKSTYAQEALVRGAQGESAARVLSQVVPDDTYKFDQACRKTAIREAVELGLSTRLHVNFMPNAVYQPENCIRVTLAVAEEMSLPLDRLTFEVVESEKVSDIAHLKTILSCYKQLGFLTALDDFGVGHCGFNMLADVQPDLVKVDIALIRGIHGDPVRRSIVKSLVALGQDLGFKVIGEGVETGDESRCLEDCGVTLQQGYFFGRPSFQKLSDPIFPPPDKAGMSA